MQDERKLKGLLSSGVVALLSTGVVAVAWVMSGVLVHTMEAIGSVVDSQFCTTSSETRCTRLGG